MGDAWAASATHSCAKTQPSRPRVDFLDFLRHIGFVCGDKIFESLLRLRSERLGHLLQLVHGFSITCLYQTLSTIFGGV